MHKILIIENDSELRDKIKEILHSRLPSMHVIDATNANATLSVLSNDTPDLILMDIQLGGYNGLKLTEEIKLQYPQITIIINSYYDSIEYRVAAHQLGADYFFSKKEHSLNDIVFLITEVFSCNAISPDTMQDPKNLYA
ncbi:MAG: response regulator [Desulfobacterales bacterium]|jgi:DNA-binding NarL/FixJ family response regulator